MHIIAPLVHIDAQKVALLGYDACPQNYCSSIMKDLRYSAWAESYCTGSSSGNKIGPCVDPTDCCYYSASYTDALPCTDESPSHPQLCACTASAPSDNRSPPPESPPPVVESPPPAVVSNAEWFFTSQSCKAACTSKGKSCSADDIKSITNESLFKGLVSKDEQAHHHSLQITYSLSAEKINHAHA